MLTPRQQFKAAFIAGAIEAGHTTPAAVLALVKQAFEPLGMLEDAAGWVGNKVVDVGLPAALLAPPVLGAAAGYGLARATTADDTDKDDIKKQELIEELHRQTQLVRQRAALRAIPLHAGGSGHGGYR